MVALTLNILQSFHMNSVGAALLCDDGSIVKGCNIENASYGAFRFFRSENPGLCQLANRN